MEAFTDADPELAAIDFRSQVMDDRVLVLMARKDQSSWVLSDYVEYLIVSA